MPKVLFATEARFDYEIMIETSDGRRGMVNVDKFLADRLGPYEDSMENAKWLALRDFSDA